MNRELRSSYLLVCLRLYTDRIVISKGSLYDVSPYEIERAEFKKGKALKKFQLM
ncbi:hypothetical protein YSA_10528 [Pseudomonas putida ND6]|uniref:Uncharacterized protein n=1 Tax=Pseudomonas putida ND6 TaxID=231023 RepID=I3V404_PSEPU|nr:hypothetical protein YSA_10528 [Pseudomonas putida ND6]